MRETSYIFAFLCNLLHINGMESFVLILSKVMKYFQSGLIFTILDALSILSVTSTIISYGMLISSITKWKLMCDMYAFVDQMNKTDMQVLQELLCFPWHFICLSKENKIQRSQICSISDHSLHCEKVMVNI